MDTAALLPCSTQSANDAHRWDTYLYCPVWVPMLLMGDIRPERLTLAGMCMGRCEEDPFLFVDDGASTGGATAVGVIAISGSFLLPALPTSPYFTNSPDITDPQY